jgi:hypothetical protein
MLKNTDTKLYLFATVVRSYDVYHVPRNIIHLLFSLFYTTVDLVSNLSNCNQPYLIIRVLLRVDDFSQVIEHNQFVLEFQFSISHLFNFNGINSFDCFINKIIGDYYLGNKNESKILNNVLFVFEGINWGTLQYIFKNLKINISGGSISRRSLLSTNQYNLSMFLYKMGYNISDIFNSSILYNKLSKNITNIYDMGFDEMLLRKILTDEIYKEIENLNKNKDILIQNISSLRGNIIQLESDVVNKKKDKFVTNKNLNSKRILNLIKTIENHKKNIEIKETNLSSLDSNLSSLNSKLNLVNNTETPIKELKDLYYKEYHNSKIIKDKFMLDHLINKHSANQQQLNKNKVLGLRS